MSSEPPKLDVSTPEALDAVRALVGLAPMPDEAAELPLARRLACAIIGLGAYERQRPPGSGAFMAMYPDKTQAMLGDLLIECGEALLASEPQAEYAPLQEPARDRFLDLVRDMAKELQAAAPPKPRLVKPNGRPLVR